MVWCNPNYFPKAPLHNTIISEVRVSIYALRRERDTTQSAPKPDQIVWMRE